jgi:NADH-quinone oxidoreductase subunit F
MSEIMILNVVPAYKEAPVSPELMKNQLEEAFNALVENEASKKYIVVDKSNKALLDEIEDKVNGIEIDGAKSLQVISIENASGFVFGNASAVEKVIDGEKPIPAFTSKKTLVYSVEELLQTKEKTVYIDGNAKKKGIYTFEKIITPKAILEQCGSVKEFKGMYFGYPMGQFVSASQLDTELPLTTDYIAIYDESDCMLDRLAAVAERYHKESCGRCVFGHEGTTQMTMVLSDMTMKKGKSDDIGLLTDLCLVMKEQSLCESGVAAANSVLTAIANFREEIEEHMTKKVCKAGVCSKFVTFHILPDLCTGCNECQDACEDDAILGKKRFIHVIDQDECVQCGKCVEACDEDAIVTAGAVKPRCPKAPIPCKR